MTTSEKAVDAKGEMSISEEAIKAAWRASLHMDASRADLIRILEAAAPYMLAEAWDEGIEAGVDGSVPECDYARNPYRPAK